MHNLLIFLRLKKPTVDSVLSSLQRTTERLKAVTDHQDNEAIRLRQVALDAECASRAANAEAARAHRIQMRITELVA